MADKTDAPRRVAILATHWRGLFPGRLPTMLASAGELGGPSFVPLRGSETAMRNAAYTSRAVRTALSTTLYGSVPLSAAHLDRSAVTTIVVMAAIHWHILERKGSTIAERGYDEVVTRITVPRFNTSALEWLTRLRCDTGVAGAITPGLALRALGPVFVELIMPATADADWRAIAEWATAKDNAVLPTLPEQWMEALLAPDNLPPAADYAVNPAALDVMSTAGGAP